MNCRECGARIHWRDYHYVTARGKRYLNRQCGACRKAYQKRYREQHAEQLRETMRQWYANNRDAHMEARRARWALEQLKQQR